MNVLNAAITKPTSRQEKKVNELLRYHQILVDMNGVAYVDPSRLEAKEAFERAFSEIFGD